MRGKMVVLENYIDSRIFMEFPAIEEEKRFCMAVHRAVNLGYNDTSERLYVVFPENEKRRIRSYSSWQKEQVSSNMQLMELSDVFIFFALQVSQGVRNGFSSEIAWRQVFSCKQAILTCSVGESLIVKAPYIFSTNYKLYEAMEFCGGFKGVTDMLYDAIPVFRLNVKKETVLS